MKNILEPSLLKKLEFDLIFFSEFEIRRTDDSEDNQTTTKTATTSAQRLTTTTQGVTTSPITTFETWTTDNVAKISKTINCGTNGQSCSEGNGDNAPTDLYETRNEPHFEKKYPKYILEKQETQYPSTENPESYSRNEPQFSSLRPQTRKNVQSDQKNESFSRNEPDFLRHQTEPNIQSGEEYGVFTRDEQDIVDFLFQK